MAQEFVIKSKILEDKINQLLPSQGGAQAGIDLSATTQIVPIIDLTESAEGSTLRQDLQTAYGLTSTDYDIRGATTTIVNTTGYYKTQGYYKSRSNVSTFARLQITDGATTKDLVTIGTNLDEPNIPYEIVVFIAAGQSLQVAAETNGQMFGIIRQIADINGNLVNP